MTGKYIGCYMDNSTRVLDPWMVDNIPSVATCLQMCANKSKTYTGMQVMYFFSALNDIDAPVDTGSPCVNIFMNIYRS